jgi:hypothetical protein
MVRTKSFLIHVTPSGSRCALVNLEENDVGIFWDNREFRPLRRGYSTWYEYLRGDATGRITGVEVHLCSDEYGAILGALPGFEEAEPFPTIAARWRLWLKREPSSIRWEQILSSNPFISDSGEVVLLLQAWHLSDAEFQQLTEFSDQQPHQ